MKSIVVGVTGQIGSGKTEVAKMLEKFGGIIISADEIGKGVVERNPIIQHRLTKAFGSEILAKSGRLRRRTLGKIAFSSPENTRKLNSIVHPQLLKELGKRVKQAKRSYPLVIVDAALLINWGWHKKVDYTILVQANSRLRAEWLKKHGFTREEIKSRTNSQIPVATQKRYADFIIHNNKSIDRLVLQVEKIVSRLASKGLTLPAKRVYLRQLC